MHMVFSEFFGLDGSEFFLAHLNDLLVSVDVILPACVDITSSANVKVNLIHGPRPRVCASFSMVGSLPINEWVMKIPSEVRFLDDGLSIIQAENPRSFEAQEAILLDPDVECFDLLVKGACCELADSSSEVGISKLPKDNCNVVVYPYFQSSEVGISKQLGDRCNVVVHPYFQSSDVVYLDLSPGHGADISNIVIGRDKELSLGDDNASPPLSGYSKDDTIYLGSVMASKHVVSGVILGVVSLSVHLASYSMKIGLNNLPEDLCNGLASHVENHVGDLVEDQVEGLIAKQVENALVGVVASSPSSLSDIRLLSPPDATSPKLSNSNLVDVRIFKVKLMDHYYVILASIYSIIIIYGIVSSHDDDCHLEDRAIYIYIGLFKFVLYFCTASLGGFACLACARQSALLSANNTAFRKRRSSELDSLVNVRRSPRLHKAKISF